MVVGKCFEEATSLAVAIWKGIWSTTAPIAAVAVVKAEVDGRGWLNHGGRDGRINSVIRALGTMTASPRHNSTRAPLCYEKGMD